jgi:hypothetical protein
MTIEDRNTIAEIVAAAEERINATTAAAVAAAEERINATTAAAVAATVAAAEERTVAAIATATRAEIKAAEERAQEFARTIETNLLSGRAGTISHSRVGSCNSIEARMWLW